jgi:hypothetical protein
LRHVSKHYGTHTDERSFAYRNSLSDQGTSAYVGTWSNRNFSGQHRTTGYRDVVSHPIAVRQYCRGHHHNVASHDYVSRHDDVGVHNTTNTQPR